MHFLLIALNILFVSFFYPEKCLNENIEEHPFYVSVFDINYNVAEKRFEIILTCFVDDLEKVLNQNVVQGKTFIKEENIDAYVMKHFNISQLRLHSLKKSIHSMSAKLYYYTDTVSRPMSKVLIVSDFFYELSPEQTNIFHFNIDQEHKDSKKNIQQNKQVVFTFD